MGPFISEVKEIWNLERKPLAETIKAFENSKKDVNGPRHITTINESLEGSRYPGTDVMYRKHIFKLNGEKVEGVFPVFKSKYDIFLPRNLRMASDDEQFKYCTKRLAIEINNNPELVKNFTARQLEQIRAGAPRISGLTWHHNEVPGKMQLVDSNLHGTCRHTGGKSIWGGGSDYR